MIGPADGKPVVIQRLGKGQIDNESGQERLGKLTVLGLRPDKSGIRGTFSTPHIKDGQSRLVGRSRWPWALFEGALQAEWYVEEGSADPIMLIRTGRYPNWLGAVTRSCERPKTSKNT